MQDKQREWLPKQLICSDFFVVLSWLLLLSLCLCCYYCYRWSQYRIINYVIYERSRQGALLWDVVMLNTGRRGKVALLLQQIENREPYKNGMRG